MAKPKPKCAGCYEKPAKLPADNPHFCTQNCAYLWAYNMVETQEWCEEHQSWDCGQFHEFIAATTNARNS